MDDSTQTPSSFESSNNVLQFPNMYTFNDDDPIPPSVEEVAARILSLKQNHITETSSFIIGSVIENLYVSGFDFNFAGSDKCVKEIALVSEALKSLLYKHYNISHPLQNIADELFETSDNLVIYKTNKEEPALTKEELLGKE